MSDLCEQADGPAHHIVEVDGIPEESLDGFALGRTHWLHVGDLVDEQPISAIGRNPARRRVRVGDVALFFQGCHVVADRGGRNTQVVPFHQRLRTYGLVRGNVVLDNGAQHGQSAVFEHGTSRRFP